MPYVGEQQESPTASFLAQTVLFRSLQPALLSELERTLPTMSCLPGHILYRPGETSTGVFLLRSGRVQVYHLSTDGRKLITFDIKADMCFGELPLFDTHTQSSFAETREEALISLVSKADIEHILAQQPAFAYDLLRYSGERFAIVEAQLVDTAFKSSTARLAQLLLDLSSLSDGDRKTLVVDGLSHEELADHLGVYRETVSAALRDLKELGAIKLGRKYISISAPELLQNLVEAGGKSSMYRKE